MGSNDLIGTSGASDKDIGVSAAHIDILPTLADICQVSLPDNVEVIDGKSLLPLIKGESVDWRDRPLFFYWTRRFTERYNNMALQQGRYKLVGFTDYDASISDFELYDLEADPGEQYNIVQKASQMVSRLRTEMDSIY